VQFLVWTLNFRFSKSSRPALKPTQPQGTGEFSLGIKQLVRVADFSLPPNVEVMLSWRTNG
jgi:hypothetical protein